MRSLRGYRRRGRWLYLRLPEPLAVDGRHMPAHLGRGPLLHGRLAIFGVADVFEDIDDIRRVVVVNRGPAGVVGFGDEQILVVGAEDFKGFHLVLPG